MLNCELVHNYVLLCFARCNKTKKTNTLSSLPRHDVGITVLQ